MNTLGEAFKTHRCSFLVKNKKQKQKHMLRDFDELIERVESLWEINSHLLQNAICEMSCKSNSKNSKPDSVFTAGPGWTEPIGMHLITTGQRFLMKRRKRQQRLFSSCIPQQICELFLYQWHKQVLWRIAVSEFIKNSCWRDHFP